MFTWNQRSSENHSIQINETSWLFLPKSAHIRSKNSTTMLPVIVPDKEKRSPPSPASQFQQEGRNHRETAVRWWWASGSTRRRRREGESSVSVVAVTHPSPNRRKKKPPAAICSAKRRPLSFPLPSPFLFISISVVAQPDPTQPNPTQPTDETISAVHSPCTNPLWSR